MGGNPTNWRKAWHSRKLGKFHTATKVPTYVPFGYPIGTYRYCKFCHKIYKVEVAGYRFCSSTCKELHDAFKGASNE